MLLYHCHVKNELGLLFYNYSFQFNEDISKSTSCFFLECYMNIYRTIKTTLVKYVIGPYIINVYFVFI